MRMMRSEHLFAALSVHAIGWFVEKDEIGVVNDGLGEFDSLLHTGREPFDEAVALLIESDLIENICRSLTRIACRQSAHLGHVADEISGRRSWGQHIRLRHVSDPFRIEIPCFEASKPRTVERSLGRSRESRGRV